MQKSEAFQPQRSVTTRTCTGPGKRFLDGTDRAEGHTEGPKPTLPAQ